MSKLLLLHVLMAITVAVLGDYQLDIMVSQYNNPTGRCEDCGDDRGCCDGFDLDTCDGDKRCDNFFVFCLRPYQTTGNDPRFCPLGLSSTPTAFRDAPHQLTFSSGNRELLGLDNPVVFTMSGQWPGAIQLAVEVIDFDGLEQSLNSNDLVDRFIIDNNDITVGADFPASVHYRGVFGFGFFDLSFRVKCLDDFYGADCTVLCQARNDSQGHYTCDSEGNRVCLEGFEDPGTGCSQQCTPPLGCSPIGGYCIVSGVCICRSGYDGTNCDIDLDPCGHTTPCPSNATCQDISPGQFECHCVEGYEGSNCEVRVGEDEENTEQDGTSTCDSLPCLNGGTCLDIATNYVCQCTEGYDGRNCENTTNGCDPFPCLNGGACMDLVIDYRCLCVDGFEGKNCGSTVEVQAVCDPNPCQNGGSCTVDLATGYDCQCTAGYDGRNCENTTNGCDPFPCLNGGACIDLVTDYRCLCVDGFEGKSCGSTVDHGVQAVCDPNPCQNGGSCTVDLATGYDCQCTAGYDGRNCENTTNGCDPFPCLNGGACIDLVTDYRCLCVDRFEGKSCNSTVEVQAVCDPNPCQNGGSCTVNLAAGYNCSCLLGFSGSDCEDDEHVVNALDNTPAQGAVNAGLLGPVLGGVGVGLVLLVIIIIIMGVAIGVVLIRQHHASKNSDLSGDPRCIRIRANPDIYSIPCVQNRACDSNSLEDNLAYAQSSTCDSDFLEDNRAYVQNNTCDSVFLEDNLAYAQNSVSSGAAK